MFTGIIEQVGTVQKVETEGNNKIFWIRSPISGELKADQSVSHNGVCLTVEECSNTNHRVTAIEETLNKTNLGSWTAGTLVNLERSIKLNDRLDGHIIQGHVDTIAKCTSINEKNGSREYTFEMDNQFGSLVIEKGSISINGISLTLYNVRDISFQVAIIPFTYEHTNIRELKIKDEVNIEFDMIGKYVNRFMALK